MKRRCPLAVYTLCLIGFASDIGILCADGTISRGRRILLDRGLQIQALTFRHPGPVDVSTWQNANFTTLNVWDRGTNPLLSEFPVGTPWSRIDQDNEDQIPADPAYRNNLVSMQYLDERHPDAAVNGTTFTNAAAAKFANWRTEYPNTVVHANFWGEQIGALELIDFTRTAKPDMLMFDHYPGQNFSTSERNRWYSVMRNYRAVALAGYTTDSGTNSGPLPYGQYLATWRSDYSVPLSSESFVRLNQNASLAFGYTFLSAFVYNETPGTAPMMFSSVGDNAPTPLFGQIAETNRQTRNLGPVLQRLVSTDILMKPGTGMTVAGTGLGFWLPQSGTTSSYVDHLTAITPTVSQGGAADPSYNDVLVGYFEPLAADSCACTFSDGLNFMIVNGSASGTAADSAQWYNLTFDFAGSNFDSLARLSRDTGDVELVPLTHDGGTTYSLDLNLPGGTGDLFRFWDSSAPLPKIVDFETTEWRTDRSSAWETGVNWDSLSTYPGQTNSVTPSEQVAIFGDVITSTRTITLDESVSLRSIEFDSSANSYFVGGTGDITLLASVEPVPDPTQILVAAGDHEISARLNLDANATIDAMSGTSLTIENTVDLGGNDLTIQGDGSVILNTQIAGDGNLNNFGTLSAGFDALLADFSSAGTLEFDVNAFGATLLTVGSASLDGLIHVDFLDGATPLGDIRLVSSDSPIDFPNGLASLRLSGARGFGLAVSEDGRSLFLIAVPEPTSASLLLFACLALLAARKRPWKPIVVSLAVVMTLAVGHASQAQIWNLVDDWSLTAPGPGIEFGPDNVWSVRAIDGATGPTSAFVDTSSAYFTPSGCTGGGCATTQYIAGYADVNADAVFKVYDNTQPWLNPNEVVKPSDHNLDPGAGVLDQGDIGAKAGIVAADIVWKAPRDMIIDAEYLAYSVGTHLPTAGGTPGVNEAETRLHFLVRDSPGMGPINPEGEPDIRVTGYSSGVGREYRSQKIAPFAVTAGQEVYLKVNRVDPDLGGPLQPSHPDRNVVGFSKIEIRDLTNLFEWRPDAPGAWTTPTNWDERVGVESPVIVDFPGDASNSSFNEHKVLFADEVSSSRTISLDSSVSVRAMEFDNPNSSFSVTGSGTIDLVASTAANPLPTEVRTTSGYHQLQVEVGFATDGNIVLGNNSTLELHREVDLGSNTLTIEPTGGLENGAVVLNSSVVGDGTIVNSATLSTGFSTLLSSASINSTGTLDFDIYPNSAGQLLVGGAVSLDGNINVDFLDGAAPTDDIVLVTSTSPIALPNGLPSLVVSGADGLSLALGGDGMSLLLTGATVGIPGDYDDSGTVSAGDLDIVLLNWGTANFPGNEANIPPGGGMFDGVVSANELDGVLLNWGRTDGASAVPEPNSAVVTFGIMTALMLSCRFRKTGAFT